MAAAKRFTELTEATTLTEDAVLPVADDGETKQIKTNLLSPGPGTDDGDSGTWNGNIYVPGRGFVKPAVDYSGSVDASAEIIARAAAMRPGQCMQLADGKLMWDRATTWDVPDGITIVGSERGMRSGPHVFAQEFPVGTLIEVYDTVKTFTLTGQEISFQHLGFHHPNQEVNATPDVYDYLFDVTGIGCDLSNLTALNPYRFARWASNGGRMDNVYAYPLSVGINLGRCPDVIRLSNVHFNPITKHNHGSTLTDWVLANGTAYVFDGPEAFACTACFAYGYDVITKFVDLDGDNFKGVSGSWTGGSMDLAGACIRVDPSHGLSATGFSVANCSLVTKQGGNGVLFLDTDVPASDVERPGVWLTNCHGNSAGTGMARMIWQPSDSYGICMMRGGVVLNVFNEVARGNSSNGGILVLRDVVNQTGDTRTAGTVDDYDGIQI
jgi:hypothetical protein